MIGIERAVQYSRLDMYPHFRFNQGLFMEL
jgi:hypothetical protein